MRNSTGGTSSAKKSQQNIGSNEEKNSAKKLVQARLPFKVIAPGSSPVASVSTTTTDTDGNKDAKSTQKSGHKDVIDARKRKLSYESDDDVKAREEPENISKENVEIIAAASKKKKIAAANSEVEIVSLLDDDEDDAVNDTTAVKDKSNTTLKTPKTTSLKGKRGRGAGTPQTTSAQRDKKDNSGSASKLQIKLPLSAGKKSKRRKSKVNCFPASATSSHDTTQQHNSYADSSDDIEEVSSILNPQKRTKLDHEKENEKDIEETTEKSIEAISLESGKDVGKSQDKRIKSPGNGSDTIDSVKFETHIIKCDEPENENILSSDDTSLQNACDDIEEVSIILNPQKRNNLDNEKKKEATKKCAEDSGSDESVSDDSKSQEMRKEPPENSSPNIDVTKSRKNTKSNVTVCEQSENKDDDPEDSVLICSDDDNDEADDETETTSIKNVNISSDISEDSKSRHNVTIESIKDSENGSLKNKSLTPKQKKMMERRQRAREEKECKLQEEKRIKQQEKEEKELAKKRERNDKEEQKRKEREEKEDLKRREREEKERKRIAEIEAKRKKNEAKEEEIRKKEEDRKRKEQEKEEAEFKKKKAAEAFTKFFVAKAPSNTQTNIEDDDNTGDGTKILAFRPFQIKGDMKLAPLCRKVFTNEAKYRLDSLLGFKLLKKDGEGDTMDIDFDGDSDSDGIDIVRAKPLPKSKLYVSELRCGKIVPGKWRRPSTESKDDVVIIEDELERVGQAIVEDTPAYVRDEMRVKFYKFHDNRRPPYYGTWRKRSSVINAKKPFAQDKEFFDYEVDSDDEWEEEEPGESLEDGSDDDKEKESEDEDYEVDNEWFVPHGHLSDEEMQNEDELGNGDDNTREAQKAKLQILQQEFAQEMKKKTEKIKPRLIGCIWIDANGNQPVECPKIIWDTLNMRAMMYTDPPVLDDPEVDEPSSPTASNTGNSEKSANDKIKPITVTDGMLKDLVRLLHGNNHSKNFLITEYIAYVQKTEESVKSGEFGNPLKAAVREKIDSIAEWQVVDATAASVAETNNIDAVNESSKKTKKKNKKRLCWVVNQETLDRMDMSSLRLQNSWEYTLTPKLKLEKESRKHDESSKTIQQQTENCSSIGKIVDSIDDSGKNTASQITKFTKVLTADEMSNKMEKFSNTITSNTSPNDSKRSTENKSKSPAAPNSKNPKEKKRVPLLMSVGRGQQISTPAKNKLISQFLQKGSKDNNKTPAAKTEVSPSPISDEDDVVILD